MLIVTGYAMGIYISWDLTSQSAEIRWMEIQPAKISHTSSARS